MKVNTEQAIKLFFQNPSLEMVFKEAIANSLDANATNIDIHIFIDSFEKQETLKVEIIDNGEGFTDERYDKFCELLKVEEETHKGVGRLVYLIYFDEIAISSYHGGYHRTFSYNQDFDKETADMLNVPCEESELKTKLTFDKCSLKRLSSYSVITPEYLSHVVIQEFFPRLYVMKTNGIDFSINFSITIPNKKPKQIVGRHSVSVTNNDIPSLKTVPVNTDLIEWFTETNMDYAIIKEEPAKTTFLMTALCVDKRTNILNDIIAAENLPATGYSLYFLLRSSIFDGKTDSSRQSLTLSETTLKTTKTLFREKVAEVIGEEIPFVKEKRGKEKDNLTKIYPHLVGYFNNSEIGVIPRAKTIDDAQKSFLKAQKEILEASTLDDAQYDKALDISSRTLAQYILYREKIIEKIEKYTDKNSEADLHNLILPKRSVLKKGDMESIYSNNLWLLDNKYMTYTTAMSERTMTEVLDEITQKANNIEDDGRPDIVIMFSDNPEKAENNSVDVVIIELKKRGISLAKTEEAESQLQQRAVKLLKHFPNKIQRMWFYGIVEFTDDFKLSLRNNHYTPLYSKDSLYYKENEWYTDLSDDSKPYKVGTYILSIDAFIKDAKANNELFLNILKEGFKQK